MRPSLAEALQTWSASTKGHAESLPRSPHDPVMFKPSSGSCDCRGWCQTVFALRGRPVLHTLPPLMLVTVVALLRSAISEFIPSTSTLHTSYALLITPISFLLVFRLNRAAVRWYDSRAAAGKMIEICRTLLGQAVAYCGHDQIACDDLCRWVVVFPMATRNYLRESALEREELKSILSDREVLMLKAAKVQPLVCLDQMRLAALRSTRSNCVNAPPVAAMALQSMEQSITILNGAMGAMERINNTPLPFAYVSHLRTFLVIYLLGLPFVVGETLGWATPVVTFLIAFSLLGIEAAAVACERPFGLGANHLPLDHFCKTVADNVAQILHQSTEHVEASSKSDKGRAGIAAAIPPSRCLLCPKWLVLSSDSCASELV